MPSVLVTGASRGYRQVDRRASGRARLGRHRRGPQRAGRRRRHRAQPAAHLLGHPRRHLRRRHRGAERVAAASGSMRSSTTRASRVGGAMETVSPDEWRKQLEINVIGQLAVTQAVLPRLRESHGRIVFISSVNGRLSMPLIGAYCGEQVRAGGRRRCAANGAAAAGGSRSSWSSPRRPTPTCGAPRTPWSSELEAAPHAGAPRPVRQAHRGLQEDDPGVAEDGRPDREGGRRRRGGADRPQAARPLRRRHRTQTAGGGDDEPADQGPRPCCCGGCPASRRHAAFVKRSAGRAAGLLRL